MKLNSQHEVDIRMIRGGRRIRIVGTRPTIMLSVNEVFKGWYEDTDHAWQALDGRGSNRPGQDRLNGGKGRV